MKNSKSGRFLQVGVALSLLLGASRVLADEPLNGNGGTVQQTESSYYYSPAAYPVSTYPPAATYPPPIGYPPAAAYPPGGGYPAPAYSAPGYPVNGYYYSPYNSSYRSAPAIPPPTNDLNSCPLQPSHYDPNGNWVAAARICP